MDNNTNIYLSVIIPVYNEEESIRPLYAKVKEACNNLDGKDYEIIFIDDGSEDSAFDILNDLHDNDSKVIVIRFRRNFGQTAAMSAGFLHAKGKFIISMDGDLQNDPEDISRLLEKIEEGYDIVCGWRKDRKDKFFSRKVPSVAANWIISMLTGLKIHDIGCSLKAYRSYLISKLPLYSEMHRFIPVMASMKGARIAEIVVKHHPRKFGYTKYGLSRVWKVFLDLFTIKMLVSFSSRPALWFAILSLPFIIIATLFLLLSFLNYFAPMPTESSYIVYSSISLLILFLVFQLNVFGFFSEFVIKTGQITETDNIIVNEVEID